MARFQSKDGTILSYRRSGTGPPLVLVHGTATDGARWRPVLPVLEQHFTVYAFDRRGYGDSGDAGSYRIEMEFDDIDALAAGIEGRPVDVVAHSYGGLCALGAACCSARLRRLVVYEPPLPTRPSAYFPPGLIPTMSDAIARNNHEAAAAAFAADVLALAPAELDTMRRLDSWTTLVAHAARMLRELENVERLSIGHDVFRACRVPTLLLVGSDSPPQYWATAEALNANLPSSRIVALPNQRHAAINAAPTLFATEVIGFLTAPAA